MGVCGCGKTTISEKLSTILNLPCYDADDFHSEVNIQKMRNSIPLGDNDRKTWLELLADKIFIWNKKKGAVLACSALKESYRQILNKNKNVIFIFLDGKKSLILERMQKRKSHYMPIYLLDSQFKELEEPDYAIKVSIDQSIDNIISFILNKIEMKKTE